MSERDTIAAIATPIGEGAIGIVRISGPEAGSILREIFRPARKVDRWVSHRLYYGHCVDEKGEFIDEVLAVWMAEGRSFTGEESCEIHAHGGILNLRQILRAAFRAGARPAEPGEFSRRAYLNGRIDLTRAEAIALMISAKSEGALRIARQHLQGRLHREIRELTDQLLYLSAAVESWLDFPEEFDPAMDAEVERIFQRLDGVIEIVKELYSSYHRGKPLRESWSIAIVGRPNVGKSSLFNALCGQDRAIVTEVPGTTRDPISEEIALGGISVSLVDTAGIRKVGDNAEPHDRIEAEGIRRTLSQLEGAHLVVAVLDASSEFTSEDGEILRKCSGKPTVLVLNKVDLGQRLELPPLEFQPVGEFRVSCKSGEGLEEFRRWLGEYLESQTPKEELVIVHERHYRALEEALEYLERARRMGEELEPEFMAEDLRSARKALAQIVGEISSEDILDVIFSQFCIGK